jgi:DNA-directed RNA polymerase specialized sigma subunit
MEEATIKLIDLSHEINDDIDRLIDLKKEILNVINEIDDFRYKLLLEMRYINCKDWDEVAKILGYDTRYILKLHGRALKEIDEILQEDTKRHRKTPGECDIL